MEKSKVTRRIMINGVCVEHKIFYVEQQSNKINIDNPSPKELEKIKKRDILAELKKRNKR